jgi:uncharacterized membrane-anchored protein YhcB (DUF1043 family)
MQRKLCETQPKETEATRSDGKIYLIGLRKNNVRQQSPYNSSAKWRKDELPNRKEPLHSHFAGVASKKIAT